MLAEVRKQAAATNGVKGSFPTVARALMACIRPFPETQQATSGWADEVCTWERFESAVGRAGADVGVGSDGYCGYLMRKAPLAVRRLGGRLRTTVRMRGPLDGGAGGGRAASRPCEGSQPSVRGAGLLAGRAVKGVS